MAEGAGARKRLKEVKAEMAATKQKLAALKTERTQLKSTIQAQRDAKASKVDKSAG